MGRQELELYNLYSYTVEKWSQNNTSSTEY